MDLTAVTNNFLHTLFSECNITLNGVTITQTREQYHYRFYVEIIMNYGTDVSASSLSNAYWYLDTGDMQPCDRRAENLMVMPNW